MRAGNQQANSSPESGAPGPFPRLCRSWVVFPRMNWSPWAFAAEGPLQRSVTIPQPPTFRTRRGKLVWMPIPAPTSPQRQLLKSKPNETAKSHSGRNRILQKRTSIFHRWCRGSPHGSAVRCQAYRVWGSLRSVRWGAPTRTGSVSERMVANCGAGGDPESPRRQAKRASIAFPPSTILRGRPIGLKFSVAGSTCRDRHIVANRSCTVTGLSFTCCPSLELAP